MAGNDGDQTLRGNPGSASIKSQSITEKLQEPIMGPIPPIFCSRGLSSPVQPGLPQREKPGEPSLPSGILKPSSQASRITGKEQPQLLPSRILAERGIGV